MTGLTNALKKELSDLPTVPINRRTNALMKSKAGLDLLQGSP